jgi:trans-aconitate 2-methyltransferase
MKYTFGTTETAARRLEDIAAYFDPLAEAFLRAHVPRRVGVALDIGCGPGFTTAMLARTCPGAEVVGLDRSPEFLAMARRRFPTLRFVRHDATVSPFPVRADVGYVRFVLSHLPQPVERANRWVGELRLGGLLIVEEVEDVLTDVDVFRCYLDANVAMIRSRGAELLVGATLAAGRYHGDVLVNDCALLPVANARAAGWFLPNARSVWPDDPVVRRLVPPERREVIADELERVRDAGGGQSDITWRMRRLVLRRGSKDGKGRT